MLLPEALAPLRDKRFAWYYGARFTSLAGSSMAPVALTFAVLHLAFTMPAMMGVVPQIVDRAYLRQANALLSFSRSGLYVVGPSIAARLVVTVGPGWALAADAITYLLAILLLLRVNLPTRESNGDTGGTSMIRELRDGWSEFAGRTWLWLVVAIFGINNAIHAGAWGVLGPVIAKATPGLGERGWGLILSAEAVGLLLMTVLMLKLSFRYPLRAGMLASACFAIPMLLLGVRPELWPLLAASFVAGLGVEVFGVGWNTALHEHIPEEVLSRVSSHDMLGSFVAMPVGMLLYGWLATVFEARSVLTVSFAVYATLALGSLLSRSIRNLESAVHGAGRDGPTGPTDEATVGGR